MSAGRDTVEGFLPAGTVVDGNSIRAARKAIRAAGYDGDTDPDLTLVCRNEGGQSAERAPLSAWRAGGIKF